VFFYCQKKSCIWNVPKNWIFSCRLEVWKFKEKNKILFLCQNHKKKTLTFCFSLWMWQGEKNYLTFCFFSCDFHKEKKAFFNFFCPCEYHNFFCWRECLCSYSWANIYYYISWWPSNPICLNVLRTIASKQFFSPCHIVKLDVSCY